MKNAELENLNKILQDKEMAFEATMAEKSDQLKRVRRDQEQEVKRIVQMSSEDM